MHTYIHASIHTHIHTYIHTCIHTYIHTYIRYMHACMHAYIHTYKPTRHHQPQMRACARRPPGLKRSSASSLLRRISHQARRPTIMKRQPDISDAWSAALPSTSAPMRRHSRPTSAIHALIRLLMAHMRATQVTGFGRKAAAGCTAPHAGPNCTSTKRPE